MKKKLYSMHIKEEDKELLQKAAEKDLRPLNTFMLKASKERAKKILSE